jgi:hypothetical protein
VVEGVSLEEAIRVKETLSSLGGEASITEH